ncbi:hypothetical protein [Thaumasiovibrio subtropicus]|uniref:hypothetical protein n=1 Tax=Thaumasiovibrio subtropicus TaxID=1891207 RepID=UPI000B35447A|nr:hypothetical protein [Thaumasiovibrio subtropicus]
MLKTTLPILSICLATFSFAANATSQFTLSSTYTENHKRYEVRDLTQSVYVADIHWQATEIDVIVTQGHQSQLGKLVINGEQVSAYSPQEDILWQAHRGNKPLCLPELMPEFALAYLEELKEGEEIRCDGPLLKAKKLAPFTISLHGVTERGYEIKVGPGSIGMWFFMDAFTFEIDVNQKTMAHFSGLLPAPDPREDEMAYLYYDGRLHQEYAIATIPQAVFEHGEGR